MHRNVTHTGVPWYPEGMCSSMDMGQCYINKDPHAYFPRTLNKLPSLYWEKSLTILQAPVYLLQWGSYQVSWRMGRVSGLLPSCRGEGLILALLWSAIFFAFIVPVPLNSSQGWEAPARQQDRAHLANYGAAASADGHNSSQGWEAARCCFPLCVQYNWLTQWRSLGDSPLKPGTDLADRLKEKESRQVRQRLLLNKGRWEPVGSDFSM